MWLQASINGESGQSKEGDVLLWSIYRIFGRTIFEIYFVGN
jgi:hypothetical protein